MRIILNAICLLFIICFPIFSLTVDFAPIKVGNIWVYKDSTANVDGTPNHILIKTISISKMSRDTKDTNNIIFNVTVRDSGIDSGRASRAIDTIYSIDSIIKKRDTIVSAGKLAIYFNLSTKDTASFVDSFSIFHIDRGSFFGFNKLIGYSHYHLNYVDVMVYEEIDTSFSLENVGLIYRFSKSSDNPGIEQWAISTIRLISFNGNSPYDISHAKRISEQNSRYNSNGSLRFKKVVVLYRMPDNQYPLHSYFYDVYGRRVQTNPSLLAKSIYFFSKQ